MRYILHMTLKFGGQTTNGCENAHIKRCAINAHIDGLVQDGSNSSALTLELLQSCAKPSICFWDLNDFRDFSIQIRWPFWNGSNVSIVTSNGLMFQDTKPLPVIVMKMFYSSISEYDGIPDGLDCLSFEDAVLKHASHESISLIKQHTAPCENFRFKVVSYETFKSYIDELKSNKAAGFDGLQAKFLKLSGYKYISFLCDIFNKCVCTNVSLHIWNLLK